MYKVYIGYDSREKIAAEVCKYSLRKNAKKKISIKYLKLNSLRKKKLYTRKEDKLSSTEFTFSRFLVPILNKFSGWAIFCDCDFLWLTDIEELFKLKNDKYAVMCVKHDYKPLNKTKMDGKAQLHYPRKNWSSLILWNCSHPANKRLSLNIINSKDGKYLHRFGWLKNSLIGSINKEWNWLVGWYKEPRDGSPKALHFTEGGPWFKNHKNVDYANLWLKEKKNFYKQIKKNI
jgi:lipopolysaccharide biosynthesis glycosyltransferase